MSAHTPGPWKQGYDDGSGQTTVTADNKGIAKTVWGCSCCQPEPKSKDLANARLIAAAPEMFEALKKIAQGEGVYGAQAREYKEIARAAIAKLEARQ